MKVSWALAILLLNAASVQAEQFGTAKEAKAMLDRAASALKSNEALALRMFNDPDNKEFHDHDLYVVCYDMSDGKITAYESPALIGVDIRTLALKDDPIGQRVYDAVQSSAQGGITTMEYNFPKPGTTEPVRKQFIETRLGNQVCGVAYYK